MKVSAINTIKTGNAAKTGKKAGTAAGLAGSSVYVLNLAKKEGFPDMFTKLPVVEEGKVVVKNLTKKGMAVKAGIIAAGVAAIIGAGRLIGGLIGKAVDHHNAKKAQ